MLNWLRLLIGIIMYLCILNPGDIYMDLSPGDTHMLVVI